MNKLKSKDKLNRYIGYSLVAHALIMAFSIGAPKCSNNEIVLPPSIQVDIVAPPKELPNKQTKKSTPSPPPEKTVEPQKTLPKKEKVEEKIEGPKVDLKLEKKKKEEAKRKELKRKKELELKKKKESERLKKQKEDQKRKAKEKQIKNQQQDAINKLKQNAALTQLTKDENINTGQRLNPGTSFSGLESIQFQKYYGNLKNHLYENWSLPQWLSELELKAQVLVVIDSGGYVTQRQILKSSGNTNFDNTVLAAIDKASPFPVAPGSLKSKIENKEIVFGFPEN